MNIIRLIKFKGYYLVISFLVLSSFSIFLTLPPSGLDEAKPMGTFLNGNFPDQFSTGAVPYEPVFPNIQFESPLTFNEVPNGDKIIVGQRDGKVFWFNHTPNVNTKTLMLDLSNKVGVVWDGGFLGMTLHPEFGNGKNFFYVYYSTRDSNGGHQPDTPKPQGCTLETSWGNFLVLVKYEINPNTLVVDINSEKTLLKLRMYNSTHRGGGLLFGDDGFLYLSTGDQAAFNKSQDITNNLDGGVLRIDVDQDPAKSHAPFKTMPEDHGYDDEISGKHYWIPNDNPFLSPDGQRFEEYYSIGHRNPHRMTKDRMTGKLYIGEIGGGTHEEINVVQKGKNYGWPAFEGSTVKTNCLTSLLDNMPHKLPLTEFPRTDANSIIGGYVYRGTEVPELYGKYICADWGFGEEIFTVDIVSGAFTQIGNFTSTNIISFGEDKQGELYILRQGNSTLFKLKPTVVSSQNFPNLLSQTGAFTSLQDLTPTDGVVPYDLIESFWSDGAEKKRWMAVPNDGNPNSPNEQIQFSENGDWQFPIGTVLIKHFELPLDQNNPNLRKRLETRFSIKASNGNFYFLTYKWNDSGTDAELLETELDEDITINQGVNQITQTWHYPNRSECLTCHNNNTGGTLGPKTRNLNKNFEYPSTGITANQLVSLSHIGLIDEDITDQQTQNYLTHKSINDPNATLEEKARSYLDLNCSYCHRSGSENRGDFDLKLSLSTQQTGLLTAGYNESIGIIDEEIVKMGIADQSILYHRINSLNQSIQMPPLAKNRIDVQGVQLIKDWINQLDNNPNGPQVGCSSSQNIAIGKTATQSSNYNGIFTPERAIDGNTFGTMFNHTKSELNAWLEVDLGDVHDLSTITIFNRTTCCQERLKDFHVLVSEVPFNSTNLTTTIAQTDVGDFHHPGIVDQATDFNINRRGRYIRVQLSGKDYLHIAEIQIYDCQDICSDPQNVALGKSSSQSSNYNNTFFPSSKTVDGNTEGTSFNHTNKDQNAWWEVDLGQSYDVSSINVFNRTNCCEGRLQDFHVLFSDVPFNSKDLNATINQNGVSDYHYPGIPSDQTVINVNRQGRYVRVQLSAKNYLHLAEVQVFACSGVSSCQFTQLTEAEAVDVGSGGGKTYVIGTNRRVYLWNGSDWIIQKPVPFFPSKIDVDGNGNPWVTAAHGRIYRWVNGDWVRVNGWASDVGCSGNDVYVIGSGHRIYKWNGGNNWSLIPGEGKRIDVNQDGNPWIVGTDNHIYQYKNNTWSKKGDIKANDISIKEGDNIIWIVDSPNRQIFNYLGAGNWKQYSGLAKNISVNDNGDVWITDNDNDIYRNDCSDIPRSLYIDNSSFSAEPMVGRKSRIFWAHNQQYYPVKYDLEYAKGDSIFELLETIPATSTNGVEIYRFVHDFPVTGVNQYRVVITYPNGVEDIVPFKTVVFGEMQSPIDVFPNPTNGLVYINLANYMDEKIDYSIIDNNGNILSIGAFDENHLPRENINLDHLQNGRYILYLRPFYHRGVAKPIILMRDQ